MAIDLDDLRPAWNTLSPRLQDAFATTIKAATGIAGTADASAVPHETDWPTVSQAARWVKLDAMAICRGIEHGEIEGNGRTGRDRRICPTSLFAWATLREFEAKPEAGQAPLQATLTPREQNREAQRERITAEYELSQSFHRSGGNQQ